MLSWKGRNRDKVSQVSDSQDDVIWEMQKREEVWTMGKSKAWRRIEEGLLVRGATHRKGFSYPPSSKSDVIKLLVVHNTTTHKRRRIPVTNRRRLGVGRRARAILD